MRKKIILIIAAGEWQIPVIKKAQSMGLEVVATDKDPLAPGLKIADYSEIVDIIDLEGTLKVAQKYKVDAVITEQTDISVPTAAYIAEKLGLPGIGYDVAIGATNKWVMREKCKKAGIPMPLYDKVKTYEEAVNVAKKIGFPIVIKPVDGQASRGIKKVEDIQNLGKWFKEAKKHSREGSILIEECVIGIESTVEGFVTKDDSYVLAISDKKHLPPPVCVAVNLIYPPNYSKEITEKIEYWDIEVMKALNISMGITHGEFMITKDGPKFLEMAARGGGSRISSHIVPAISGIDIIEGLIVQALGEDFTIKQKTSNAAILEFFILPQGKIKSIRGVEEARKIEGVIEIKFQVGQGDSIEVIDNDRVRPGFFVAIGKTRKEVIDVAQKVKETVRVEMEEGNVK